MSRKIKFSTVYQEKDGQRIDIPALKGRDGGGSGGYDDTAIKTRVKAVEDTVNSTTIGNAALKSEVTEVKSDISEQIELLKQVRDALKNGDIDGAIGLLDSFLLDKEVLA